jgi:hypothetical protein
MSLRSRLLPLALCLAAASRPDAAPVNLAPAATISASSSGFGSVPTDANDGNRDGHFFGSGSVWHTLIPDTAPWIEADLGRDCFLDHLIISPRTDALQGTVRNLRITVTTNAGTTVFNQSFLPSQVASHPWGTAAIRGLTGRKIRIERTDIPASPDFLTFSELEILGSTIQPGPPNLALNKPRTASNPGGFSTPPNAGNDGNIDGDYNHLGRPIYHSAATGIGQFYEIDLANGSPTDHAVDFLRFFNRTDFTSNTSLRFSLRNAAGTTVWAENISVSRDTIVRGGRQYDITIDPPGVLAARWLRVETIAPESLVFAELEAFGPETDITPPTIASLDPPASSAVPDLNLVTVTFSEPVTGVSADDLLINGQPASSSEPQNATTYLFAFPPPPPGAVNFSWSPSHAISDAAGNPFNPSPWSLTIDPSLPSTTPYLSEFMADNRGGLEDEDSDSPDWIEIANPGPASLNLGGWYLSDRPASPALWRFPSPTIIPPGGHLVVFASSKNRRVPGKPLHTNFRLDPDGDSVLLTRPDGVSVVSSFLNYPRQLTNVSWGLGRDLAPVPAIAPGSPGSFLIPTSAIPDWSAPSFNDSSWPRAVSGIGFDQSTGTSNDGPLGLWRFNDTSIPGKAPDATGRTPDASITGATYSADRGGFSSQPGDRALNFSGNAAVSITAAATGAFDATAAANTVAISLWTFGAPSMPVASFLFFAGSNADTSGTRVLGTHLPWTDSVIYWDTGGCCDSRYRANVGEPNPLNWRGRWNHYVFQKIGDRKEIWQNGSLLHSDTNTEPLPTFRSLIIGAANAAGASAYQGLIDDFAIWSRPLSSTQIAALAAGTSPLEISRLTPYIGTDVSQPMRNTNSSALLRLPFTITNPADISLLNLNLRYDDGFVAFLNGTPVARRNAPAGTPAWNATASVSRSGSAASIPESFDLSAFTNLLRNGPNLLAIHGLNVSASDPTFLLDPELVTGRLQPARFFPQPSPGSTNPSGVSGFTADTKFSHDRGFYDAPFDLTITCATPGAVIVTTTDGSLPTLTNGTASPAPATRRITSTTSLRAAAFVPGTDLGPANTDTQTYLFLSQVATQQRPAAAPLTWPSGHPGDYSLDPRVTSTTQPGYTLRDSLLSIPTLCLTAAPSDLWSASGIYANSTSRGDAWERAAHAEWLDPATNASFSTGFGIAIHGNISRDKSFTPKHSFKMLFRSQFGPTKLRYPVFPNSPITEFDQLTLRAGSTDTFPCTEWGTHPLGPDGAPYQRWARSQATYIRDQWVRNSQLAMGHLSARGRYVHLYLNGTYWGLYNLCEHPDEDFQASHLGGNPTDYDVTVGFAELKNGNINAWNQLMSLSGTSASDAVFQLLMGNNPDGSRNPAFPVLLDADNLIDYMVLHIFHGADDWPNHNWWSGAASRNPSPLINRGFQWFAWDQEISNVSTLYERSAWQSPPSKYADVSAANSPAAPYYALRQGSPAFRLRFADRVHRHLFNAGALTTSSATARWNALAAEIDRAVVAESARWGDYQPHLTRPGQPYRRESDWLPNLTSMASNFWPQINATALKRFRDAGLYPATAAPTINRFGGQYLPDFRVALTNPNSSGTIYFTLDGSDPRRPDNAPLPAATTYSAPFTLSGPVTLKARIRVGTTWSALLETDFIPHPDRDFDSMPNDWESLHNLNPDSPLDASSDADGDGQPNAAEYAASTNPRDATDALRATASLTPEGIAISVLTRANRRYRLEASPSGTAWQSIASRDPAADDAPHSWSVPLTENRRFFRVVVSLP